MEKDARGEMRHATILIKEDNNKNPYISIIEIGEVMDLWVTIKVEESFVDKLERTSSESNNLRVIEEPLDLGLRPRSFEEDGICYDSLAIDEDIHIADACAPLP
ncbi:unnamed protein product [Dovyalis caffra]|uniref:Uncharacterized protein n=1 Tax=Dovyalis caffra TaxID=77055 RepID=A0AAV1RM93_9ROSI|nr:unnamed protein product [Dovyalis caffra]